MPNGNKPKTVFLTSRSTGNFYGWWIIVAGSIILFVSSGIGFYGHGVILDPLRSIHGWSKGTVSSAITTFFFSNGIVGLLIGRWMDRYGPKWFLVCGSVLFGLSIGALNWCNIRPNPELPDSLHIFCRRQFCRHDGHHFCQTSLQRRYWYITMKSSETVKSGTPLNL